MGLWMMRQTSLPLSAALTHELQRATDCLTCPHCLSCPRPAVPILVHFVFALSAPPPLHARAVGFMSLSCSLSLKPKTGTPQTPRWRIES